MTTAAASPSPPWWRRRLLLRPRLWVGLAAMGSALAWAGAFPRVGAAPLVFVFAVPLLLAARLPVSRRCWRFACLGSGVLGWVLTLLWLRFVAPPFGLAGVLGLGVLLGLFSGLWLWWAGRVFAAKASASTFARIAAWLGLAVGWVALEWVRSWFLTGFPWAPAAAALWQAPALLQLAAWVGQGGVSFAIVFTNLALAHAVIALPGRLRDGPELRPLHLTTALRPTPELALVALWVAGSLGVFAQTAGSSGRAVPLARATVVQPWMPAELNLTAERRAEFFRTLLDLTVAAAEAHPDSDFILWPEAAVPYWLRQDGADGVRPVLRQLAQTVGQPVLHGNTLARGNDDSLSWVNGLFLLQRNGEVAETHYAKRRLVPFGEYVPLRPVFGWLGRLIDHLPADTQPGTEVQLLDVPTANGTLRVGALICYEDIFPPLGYEAATGADLLVVVTNDAWYGTGGGAYQHAMHSVLRAVETRTPLLRGGNHGWSGWIDEWGRIRNVLTDETGSIYTQGYAAFAVQADARFAGEARGPAGAAWFTGACVLGAVATLLRRRRGHFPAPYWKSAP